MDLLPAELLFAVWLETDYEDLKTLCRTARQSPDPKLELTRELCNDPTSWISRARIKLGVDPADFWSRSSVEQALPLPGESEAERAQMRYVELVSRTGAVSDSVYFLHPWEVVGRAVTSNNQALFSRAIEQAWEIPPLDPNMPKTRYMSYYQKGMSSGSSIRKQPTETELDKQTEMVHKIAPRLNAIGRTTSSALVINGLIKINDPTLFKEFIETYPNIFREIEQTSFETSLKKSDPEIVKLLVRRIFQGQTGVVRYNGHSLTRAEILFRLKEIIISMVERNRAGIADDIIDIIGFRFPSNPLVIWEKELSGSYGLLIAEWLIKHGYDLKGGSIRGSIPSRAVEAYLINN